MNENFCSDIVSLFLNHLWECPECLDKVGDYIFSTFILVGSLSLILLLVFTYVFFLIWRTVDGLLYKKKFTELESEFEKLNDSYSELLSDYYKVTLRCSDLEKKIKS